MPRLRRENSLRTRGVHTTRIVLPGESVEDFDALHAQLIAEFEPDGVVEADSVREIARCLWRKSRLDGLKRAPLPEGVSCAYIMDPRHARYEPGKWTYAYKSTHMPGAPAPPPYVPNYLPHARDLERASPPIAAEACLDGEVEESDGRPTVDTILEEFLVEANFDVLIRRHVLCLLRLKTLKQLIRNARKPIDVTPEPPQLVSKVG